MTARVRPSRPIAQAAGLGLVALAVLAAAVQTVALTVSGDAFAAATLGEPFPIVTVATVVGSAVGWVIIRRHRQHPVGWLFLVGYAGAAVGLGADAVGNALVTDRWAGSETLGQNLVWIGALFGAPWALAVLGSLFAIAPDGRLSGRWGRTSVWLLGAGFTATVGGLLLIPARTLVADDPGQVSQPALVALVGGQLTVAVGTVCATIALVRRLRRADGEERQQLRWITTAAAALAISVSMAVLADFVGGYYGDSALLRAVSVLLYLSYLAVPVATAFAVLRHRLYDIDRIIGGAVVVGVVGGTVTVASVAVITAAAWLTGGWAAGTLPTALAVVLVALLVQPLRRWARRLSRRAVYGAKAVPYEQLAEFTANLGSGLPESALLGRTAQFATQVTGAVRAAVSLDLTGGSGKAYWPPETAVTDTDAQSWIDVPVRHRGSHVATIWLDLPPAARRDLEATGLTDGVSIAMHNAQLTRQLLQHAEGLLAADAELAASKQRIVMAGQTEAGRLAESVRRSVTAPVSRVRETVHELRLEPELTDADAARLEDAATVSLQALEDLRVLTHGLLPSLLSTHGVETALRHSELVPDAHLSTGMAWQTRLPATLEGAVYRCCLDLLALHPASSTVPPWVHLDREKTGGQRHPARRRAHCAAGHRLGRGAQHPPASWSTECRP